MQSKQVWWLYSFLLSTLLFLYGRPSSTHCKMESYHVHIPRSRIGGGGEKGKRIHTSSLLRKFPGNYHILLTLTLHWPKSVTWPHLSCKGGWEMLLLFLNAMCSAKKCTVIEKWENAYWKRANSLQCIYRESNILFCFVNNPQKYVISIAFLSIISFPYFLS